MRLAPASLIRLRVPRVPLQHVVMRTEPVTALENQAARVLSEVERTREPIMITRRGLPTACLVDVETWERLQERLRLLEGIARGERAVREGRVSSHARARTRLAR